MMKIACYAFLLGNFALPLSAKTPADIGLIPDIPASQIMIVAQTENIGIVTKVESRKIEIGKKLVTVSLQCYAWHGNWTFDLAYQINSKIYMIEAQYQNGSLLQERIIPGTETLETEPLVVKNETGTDSGDCNEQRTTYQRLIVDENP